MSVKLLTEHHLEFLSLRGSCTGSSESTLFKMPHCWKSHVMAQMKAQHFYTTFLVLISPLSQSSIFGVEFKHLNQDFPKILVLEN